MTPLTPIMRAFRSELIKCLRWSMLAGTGLMLVPSAFFSYLTFHQIISGATGREIDPLAHAFPTSLGLITVVGQARAFIIAVALIIVTANLAAEWSQGTWRNLLVREPRRLRLLTGKMLALILFVLVSMTLTLLGSSGLILALASAQGVPIAAWLRGPLREWAESLLAPARLASDGFVRVAPVRRAWQEHLEGTRNWQYPLWTVLMLQAWRERWA